MWLLRQLGEIALVITVAGLFIKLIHRVVFRGVFRAIFGFSWDKEC